MTVHCHCTDACRCRQRFARGAAHVAAGGGDRYNHIFRSNFFGFVVSVTSSLLTNLNPEQLAAVTLPHSSALILAGAGSGKTRVLTTRIAWLLATGQAAPQSILAVTFTNKAAREMLTRLSALTPLNIRGMWVGTCHGLCDRMRRAHYVDAGRP